jgi:hypothetical protein
VRRVASPRRIGRRAAEAVDDEASLLVSVVLAAFALRVPARMPPVIAPTASRPAAPAQRALRPGAQSESFMGPSGIMAAASVAADDKTMGSETIPGVCRRCGFSVPAFETVAVADALSPFSRSRRLGWLVS